MKLVATVGTPALRRVEIGDARAIRAAADRRDRRLRAEYLLNQRIAWRAVPAPGIEDYCESVSGVLCEAQDGDLYVREPGRNWFTPFDRTKQHHRDAWRATAAGAGVGFLELEPGGS